MARALEMMLDIRRASVCIGGGGGRGDPLLRSTAVARVHRTGVAALLGFRANREMHRTLVARSS